LSLWASVATRSVILFGAVAYLISLFAIIMPWRAKVTFRQQKALSEPASIEIRGEGLYRKSQHAESLTPWAHIIRWRHGNKVSLLYLANNVFFIVPSHFFASPDDYVAFAEAIKVRLGIPS
jgi:hypothetical protein